MKSVIRPHVATKWRNRIGYQQKCTQLKSNTAQHLKWRDTRRHLTGILDCI